MTRRISIFKNNKFYATIQVLNCPERLSSESERIFFHLTVQEKVNKMFKNVTWELQR